MIGHSSYISSNSSTFFGKKKTTLLLSCMEFVRLQLSFLSKYEATAMKRATLASTKETGETACLAGFYTFWCTD